MMSTQKRYGLATEFSKEPKEAKEPNEFKRESKKESKKK